MATSNERSTSTVAATPAAKAAMQVAEVDEGILAATEAYRVAVEMQAKEEQALERATAAQAEAMSKLVEARKLLKTAADRRLVLEQDKVIAQDRLIKEQKVKIEHITHERDEALATIVQLRADLAKMTSERDVALRELSAEKAAHAANVAAAREAHAADRDLFEQVFSSLFNDSLALGGTATQNNFARPHTLLARDMALVGMEAAACKDNKGLFLVEMKKQFSGFNVVTLRMGGVEGPYLAHASGGEVVLQPASAFEDGQCQWLQFTIPDGKRTFSDKKALHVKPKRVALYNKGMWLRVNGVNHAVDAAVHLDTNETIIMEPRQHQGQTLYALQCVANDAYVWPKAKA